MSLSIDFDLMPTDSPVSTVPPDLPAVVADALPEPAEPSEQSRFVDVPIERIDDVVQRMNELLVGWSAFEQRMADLARLATELEFRTDRLQSVAGHSETPSVESECARSGLDQAPIEQPAEAIQDVQILAADMEAAVAELRGQLTGQAKLAGELQDRLMRLRFVPLASLEDRLERTIRETSTACGNQVDWILDDGQIELDTTVVVRLADSLLQLAHNAVIHGIEAPSARIAAGKTPVGQVKLRAYREGGLIIIQMIDDGSGVDPALVRRMAVAREILSADAAAKLSDTDAVNLIFRSTGAGMNIVQNQVRKLKGAVAVESTPGRGTTVTIRLPVIQTLTRGLFVRANGQTFALPFDSVIQFLRLAPGQIDSAGPEPVLEHNGQIYAVHRLAELLQLAESGEPSTRPPGVIVDVGGRHIVLIVDQLLGGREIVIKPLGSHLGRVLG
ncbi:MAG TPA: chemotaxis protein CheW, partial [Chloroflexota bacterium]|nr:chemotaxis protein CheW [Chloroflexota bacterium]